MLLQSVIKNIISGTSDIIIKNAVCAAYAPILSSLHLSSNRRLSKNTRFIVFLSSVSFPVFPFRSVFKKSFLQRRLLLIRFGHF